VVDLTDEALEHFDAFSDHCPVGVSLQRVAKCMRPCRVRVRGEEPVHLFAPLGLQQGPVEELEAHAADGRMHHIVERLQPCARPCPRKGLRRKKGRRRENLVDVLADHRGLEDHLAVVHQRRNNAVRVELQVFRPQMLEPEKLEAPVGPGQVLLGKHHAHFERVDRVPLVK
jgi:hypothetical protein